MRIILVSDSLLIRIVYRWNEVQSWNSIKRVAYEISEKIECKEDSPSPIPTHTHTSNVYSKTENEWLHFAVQKGNEKRVDVEQSEIKK